MTVITFQSALTLTEEDGTDTAWKELPMTGYHLFPYNTGFTLADETWVLEFYVLPGRYRDLLMGHLMKLDPATGDYIAVYDGSYKTGVQITIDNLIRIYCFDVRADLLDNYKTKSVEGSYSVGVSEII